MIIAIEGQPEQRRSVCPLVNLMKLEGGGILGSEEGIGQAYPVIQDVLMPWKAGRLRTAFSRRRSAAASVPTAQAS